jgi:hypothetical protein
MRIPSLRLGCELAHEHISAALDGELARFAALRLRIHTLVCASCRGYGTELSSLTGILRNERRSRRLAFLHPRAVLALPLPVAAVAALVLVLSLPHQRQAVYRGGALSPAEALPAYALSPTEAMPVYETSINEFSKFVH